MSMFIEENQGDTASTSNEADVLRGNYNGCSPSAGGSNSEQFESSQLLTSDAGLISATGLNSRITDAERKPLPTGETVQLGSSSEAHSRNSSEEKEFSLCGRTNDGMSHNSTSEHHESQIDGEEACRGVISCYESTPAGTHSPRTELGNLMDEPLVSKKESRCAGGPPQTGSANLLSSAQPCGGRTPGIGQSRRTMHQMQEGEDARRSEASVTADARRVRRPTPESSTSREHNGTPQRLRGQQSRQMTNMTERARGPAGPDAGAATVARSSSEKEGNSLKRVPQPSSAANSARRQLEHKLGKSLPTQQHSTSCQSVPVSRRTSLLNCAEAEKKKVYSRGSTMDTEVSSARSEDMHANEAQHRQTVCKRNFIRENAQSAYVVQQHQRQTKATKGKLEPPRRHSSFGKIPDYLSQIKSQLREEAKKALDKEAAEKLPPGMRVMGNEERLETVRRLKKEQTEAEHELSRMPIAIKTDGQRRRVEYLERRLGELDREQEKYSKPNILVGV